MRNAFVLFVYAGCSHSQPDRQKIEIPNVDFEPYSWALDGEEMKALRVLSRHLPSGTPITLETCATSAGDGEYFRRERAAWVEYFLVHGNPLDVRISICNQPDPEKARRIYISVGDEYS